MGIAGVRKIGLTLLAVAIAGLTACSVRKPDAAAESGNAAGYGLPAENVQLKAVTMGKEPASGMDSFYRQLDALTIEDLGITVRFDFIPWGEERNEIGRAIEAKDYDLYVGGFWTDFKQYAKRNAFVDLVPLLDQVPALTEHYGDLLDRAKLDGKLYGLPSFGKPGAGFYGVLYREDLRLQWGLQPIDSFNALEQYLYKAKQQYPNTPMINDKRFGDVLWDMLAGGDYYTIDNDYAVAPVKDPYKVMSKYDTPEYEQLVRKAKQWYDDGIVDRDILASQGNQTSKTFELMKIDKKPLEFSNHFGAVTGNYIDVLKARYPEQRFGWLDIGFDLHPEKVFLPEVSVDTSSMISIGLNSLHPELALKFLEKAHSDRAYYDLLMYGVEGENYKLEDGRVSYERISEQNRKPGWTGLYDGYMAYPAKAPGEWQAIVDKLTVTEGPKLAEANGIDPYEGFIFNTSFVSEEHERLEKIRVAYVQPLAVGVSNDIGSELAEMRSELKKAGMDAYLNALQSQLYTYAASRSVRR
ncbi:extracellular solute-binding protein [Paenibacillus harenae]|uniref:ABC-type glycerol-3-phosphate transport system substrate-binding protein n=1 Tax=Paenibacillus harenae TaxID=306543 RepID=A0ABT9TZ74_PAEHA|nr:extracellular solute-binding protein [Paenibacillus harenae]MDQ0112166.1 ABC-type glycerol-3-phosphate transport system substrate-binding protein [Paenibacillus harenae]